MSRVTSAIVGMIGTLFGLTRRAHPRRWAPTLLTAVLAVAVAAFGAGPASAATTSAAQTRVGASTSVSHVVVGASAGVVAGQRLGNDPPRVWIVVATGVAADAAAGAGDHIVLGLRAQGLEQTAAKVGGRTLLKDPAWQDTLRAAVNDPSTKFTVSLDGMSGSSTYSQVMGAAQRGASGAGGYTDWEMTQLYQAGRLGDTTFVRGGVSVENPFVP
jgi:hypothetical protein